MSLDQVNAKQGELVAAKALTNTQDQPVRKVFLETWGCQMNVADSESMLSSLNDLNFQLTNSEDEADLFLLNTCHIREKASHKVLSRLGRLRDLKKSKQTDLMIAVTGCVAQAESKKLKSKAPYIDLILGPGRIPEFKGAMTRLLETKARGKGNGSQILTGFTGAAPALGNELNVKPLVDGKNQISRFVNITQGCNNFCTFCVVPFTRGREISAAPADILAECRGLVQSGALEITLLGQNVNSYGLDLVKEDVVPESRETPFVNLLRQVCKVEGLERVRFTTSNPHDFGYDLAELFQEETKLGSYLHLPVQSGSNEILEKMKRKVTATEYLEKIGWLRSGRDGADFAVSTDLIVGFPGETEEDFQATLDLVETVKFSFVYAFKYSSRPGTAAARFKLQISEAEKSKRLQRLFELQDRITVEQNRNEIGKVREVLITYRSQKDPDVYYGRTQHFRLVKIASPRQLIGQTIDVEILDANKTALVGRPSKLNFDSLQNRGSSHSQPAGMTAGRTLVSN